MLNTNHSFDVVIVGGGIIGLCAAIAMSQRNFSVAVLDAGSLSAELCGIDPRVYAINHASKALLQRLQVWEKLDQTRLSPYTHMHVWDAPSKASIDFDARMIADDRLGTIIEESVIKQALLQQIALQNISLFPDSKVSNVCLSKEDVVVSDSNYSWQGKLLIVADGANSATRQLLQVPITTWPYHQHALVATVQIEKSHHSTAYQVFNADGPLAFLPLANPYQCSIVWSTRPFKAKKLMSLSDEQFIYQLAHAFGRKLGDCQLLGKRYEFPLYMRHTKNYCGARWVLMGDAAHTIHPLAGLGLNVGLADVTTWLATMDAATSQELGSMRTHNAYHRQRKHDVWQTIAMLESIKALFANPLPPVAALRCLGLSACDRLLPLKRFLIAQAADN